MKTSPSLLVALLTLCMITTGKLNSVKTLEFDKYLETLLLAANS